MPLKTRYRKRYRDGGRVDLAGQAELPTEQPTGHPTEAAPPEAPPAPPDNAPEPPAPPQPEPQPQHDDAALALQKQIANLKKSEQLQRQRAAMPQQPAREQKLALWRQTGMSDGEADFLAKHPQMIDHADILAYAVGQANQVHQRDTPAHYDAVKKIFDAHVEHLMREQAQAAQPAMQPTAPTPAFFKVPPGPAARSAPNPSSKFSAPVSREIPSGGSGKRHNPGKITLSAQEVEAARISGISPEEYAKQKIRKAEMIASGEYGEQPPR
jgi:hypothetical protein